MKLSRERRAVNRSHKTPVRLRRLRKAAPGGRELAPSAGGQRQGGISKGPFQFARPCRHCAGPGKPGEICASCGGSGRKARLTRSSDHPGRVDTGSRIRPREGRAGSSADSGSLLIETHITNDHLLEREGPNQKVRLPVTFSEAGLGAKIEIPTMTGKTLLKIPPNTGSGQVFRLRGKGMPSLLGGSSGDLLVEVYFRARHHRRKEKGTFKGIRAFEPRNQEEMGL